VNEPGLKSDLVSTAISLATGYLTKKVIIGATNNPIKMVLGTILQMGVSGLVSKNSDEIKTAAAQLINKFFRKNDKPDIHEF
jgi:tRNA(Arg) A34 adenosine deaminase TadA